MSLNFLTRFFYLSYLEITISAALTISLCIETFDIIYAGILLASLTIVIAVYCIFYNK